LRGEVWFGKTCKGELKAAVVFGGGVKGKNGQRAPDHRAMKGRSISKCTDGPKKKRSQQTKNGRMKREGLERGKGDFIERR